MSQHITVTRMFGSQAKIKTRKPPPPRTCLLCYREYVDDAFRHREASDSLDIENDQNAFTIFCKILDVDPTAHSASWDFENEPMPFCTSCNSLAFRLSGLYDELGVIQQEIILNTEMIKGTIQQSQDRSSRRVSSDTRVDAFRHEVFQLMRRLSSSSNTGESYLQKYEDEDEMDHDQDRYERQEEGEQYGNRERSSDRDSLEGVRGNPPYFRKNSDPRAVPVLPMSPPNYTHAEFYKEPKPVVHELKKEKRHRHTEDYQHSCTKPMGEVKRKAVFVRNDIEVYEIEDSSLLGMNNNDHKFRNKNLESSTTEYGKLLESQLRIQRSYNQHFKHEAPCPLPLVKPHHNSRPTFPSPPFDSSPANLQETPISNEKMVPNFVPQRSPPYLSNNSSSPPHHESQRMTPPDSPTTPPGMHNCRVCGKQYNKPYQLKAHLRLHTGEKPYRCSICCKTFRLAGNLRVHVRIHTGETPYECQFCGKRCTQKSQLNTHVLIHHKKSEQLKRESQ